MSSLLRSLITDYYTRHGTGGALHVVLDDLNIEDLFITAQLADLDRLLVDLVCDEEDCPGWCDTEAHMIGEMLSKLSLPRITLDSVRAGFSEEIPIMRDEDR